MLKAGVRNRSLTDRLDEVLYIHTIRQPSYIHWIHMADAGFRIRIDDDLRTAFIRTCRSNDQTAAQVLRAFMRQYVGAVESSAQTYSKSEQRTPDQSKQ